MINFNTTVPSASTDLTALTEDRLHPVLSFNVRRQVWGYGIDSRTHVLGTIVFILGILVVCVRTILILVTRYRERSPTELMVAAMKYQMGKDVFEGMENNEIGMSKAKFRMWEDEKDEICFEDK